MDASTFFILFFTFMFLNIEAIEANCPSVKCTHGGPDIRFPFRVQDQQLQHSGHPGFELLCRDNTTKIHFPSYGDLVIKSISYNVKKFHLLDPKNCLHEVFLNLNLSLTPFQYYYVVKNYTYLNCSSRLSPSYTEVPCLSSSRHHVYTVETSLAVPLFCRAVKTVAIPFAYSPYLSDNSFGLGLTWDLPGCKDCEATEGHSGLQSKTEGCFHKAQYKGFSSKLIFIVLSMSIFIFSVTTLIIISIKQFKKMDGQIAKENQLVVQKLLGDYI